MQQLTFLRGNGAISEGQRSDFDKRATAVPPWEHFLTKPLEYLKTAGGD
jgi:hypothetical protein